MAAQAGLCLTWSETPVLSCRGSFYFASLNLWPIFMQEMNFLMFQMKCRPYRTWSKANYYFFIQNLKQLHFIKTGKGMELRAFFGVKIEFDYDKSCTFNRISIILRGCFTNRDKTWEKAENLNKYQLTCCNYVSPPKGRVIYCFWLGSRWCRRRRRRQSQYRRDSFLSARYLRNRLTDFNQICMYITLGHNEELISF